MISSGLNKGLAQEPSPVDTDQIYHCGNVTWLVRCLSCESAEQKDIDLQHVQYLSSPFPLTGADFVFNIIKEWFFIAKVTSEFVLKVCLGFFIRPTRPLQCYRDLGDHNPSWEQDNPSFQKVNQMEGLLNSISQKMKVLPHQKEKSFLFCCFVHLQEINRDLLYFSVGYSGCFPIILKRDLLFYSSQFKDRHWLE